MTDTMTSQNIDLSSWDTLYITKCTKCLNFIYRHSQVFNVVSSYHAADVPSLSDFNPNSMNHVRVCGRNRFCYPHLSKIFIMWGDFCDTWS
jgi:hypothetical protein